MEQREVKYAQSLKCANETCN